MKKNIYAYTYIYIYNYIYINIYRLYLDYCIALVNRLGNIKYKQITQAFPWNMEHAWMIWSASM